MIGWAIRQSVKRKVQPLAQAAGRKLAAVKARINRGKKNFKEARKRGARATKDAILPLLPGVSTLKLPESPVPHLLLCNDPPTDHDVALARHVIKSVEEEEERMKGKMFLRPSNLGVGYWGTVTKHKMEQTAMFIEQHRAVVSPLRRLPNEILQEIFVRVNGPRSGARSWTNASEIPWALAQVCRSWRINALSVSALWSRLPTMDLSKSDPRSRTKVQLEYLEELLHRSRSAPLDLYLFSLGFNGTSHPVIDLLLRHCERWQAVTIKINISILPRLFEIKGRLPKLESLSLYLSGYGEGVPTIDMFEGAPQLRQVDVGGPFLAELALPFEQLERYKDKMRMRNSITRVVTAANSLEALTILELCESSGTPPIPPVTLPALRKLQVKFCCTRPEFLNNLSVPAIEEIKMVSYHDRGGLIPTIVNIVNNSQHRICPLKTLRFRTHAILEGQLSGLLRLTPLLTSLDMPLPPSHDINVLATQSSLVPHLQACDFFINDVINTSLDTEVASALNAFAAARCEPRFLGGLGLTPRPLAPSPAPTPFSIDHHAPQPSSSDAFTSLPSSSASTSFFLPVRPPNTPSFDLDAEPRRLEKFTLHFDSSRWISMQKAALEGWKPTAASHYLRGLKHSLHEELPELDSCRARRVRKFDRRWVEKVKSILIGVEDLEPMMPEDVFLSEIHLSLRSMSEKRIGVGDKHRLYERAKQILDKWEPAFQTSLQSCRWIMSGEHGMVYIPQDDALRASPQALASLLTLGRTIFGGSIAGVGSGTTKDSINFLISLGTVL
ncbi:hypothetical protein CPB83DRAFT_904918 [Crepidotus variabilis]|uniref:F-box domain-containing protein n=1 Tax=Crepidotus variabilis TaxID=179855 RepID=A0A9P6EJM0_9AGAR|nr:hypothetical protein CPB83DRAFT_904918 [Crepidotus variabilis]